ncbi:MAG TPA: CHAP domain-containing protein [Candidatus Saccharimonadales bacterium]|nr:CHAP domain-containing protein [Candidatus Saccharimonadales bacterium]
MPKTTTIAAYAGVFLLVISMVAIGYQPPQNLDTVANAAQTSDTNTAQPSVDQLVATNIAAGIAERADLPIATNVANLSVSLSAESQLAQNDTNVISKPQIIQPSADGRTIAHYTAVAGDTAESVAAKFGISADTVKWANNLSSDAIEVGKQLAIPPVNGVVYTTKDGDTADSLASKYGSTAKDIIAFNDLEVGGLTSGRQIIIPGGVLPETERPGYVAPSKAASQGAYNGGYSTVNAQIATASAGNRYAFGNCTWYAYERRLQLGRPVGSFWGNAATWAMYAQAAGFRVDNTPEVGAVMQNGGGYGHVAIVESVNSDGSITISEMNYAGNFNRVTSRTVGAGSVGSFNYIH